MVYISEFQLANTVWSSEF